MTSDSGMRQNRAMSFFDHSDEFFIAWNLNPGQVVRVEPTDDAGLQALGAPDWTRNVSARVTVQLRGRNGVARVK